MASKKQTELINLWTKKGYLVINLIKTNKNGIPDLQALRNKKVVFIESKEHGDTVKQLQIFRMRELTKNGFQCYVNEQKFEKWLEDNPQ